MKNNKQHTIKKSYTKPVIEEVVIDVAISLQSLSTKPPGEPGEGDDPEIPPGTDGSIGPEYSTKYRSENPFGGNSPNYK